MLLLLLLFYSFSNEQRYVTKQSPWSRSIYSSVVRTYVRRNEYKYPIGRIIHSSGTTMDGWMDGWLAHFILPNLPISTYFLHHYNNKINNNNNNHCYYNPFYTYIYIIYSLYMLYFPYLYYFIYFLQLSLPPLLLHLLLPQGPHSSLPSMQKPSLTPSETMSP